MAVIHRVRVVFTGLPGLPGVSTFYGNAGADMIGPLHDFYESLKNNMPAGMNAQVENFGDAIEDTTGTLVGSWTGTAQPVVTSTVSGLYAAPIGACINWLTNTVSSGRRLRGRTFYVPLLATQYDTNGSLGAGFLGALTTACATLQVATVATFVVWRRPRAAKPADGSRPAVTARPGSSALVTASSFKDKTAVLRSRRD